MRCIIRVDSSTHIGTGHVMRCLTLANCLRHYGHEVLFVCRDLQGNLISYIQQLDFEVVTLFGPKNIKLEFGSEYLSWLGVSYSQEIKEIKTILQSQSIEVDCIIVDHYALDYQWEFSVRPFTKTIFVIDDLANRQHDCDILLDQNFYLKASSRYQSLIPKSCITLLGPEYALLREEFLIQGQSERKIVNRVNRVLVFLGGADPTNETQKALSALFKLPQSIQPEFIDVVVGKSNPNITQIQYFCEGKNNIQIHLNINNMAELMSQADLAIGAGGSTMWERCYLGLPTVVIVVAENQIELTEDLDKAGAIVYAGQCQDVSVDSLRNSLEKLMLDIDHLNQLSYQSMKIIQSGMGAQYCVKTIEKYLDAKGVS